jgi:hypothetical protein
LPQPPVPSRKGWSGLIHRVMHRPWIIGYGDTLGDEKPRR